MGYEEGAHNWEKVLWKRQTYYPDNYVPPKLFLASLQRNRELRFFLFTKNHN